MICNIVVLNTTIQNTLKTNFASMRWITISTQYSLRSFYTLHSSSRGCSILSMKFANGILTASKHAYLIVQEVKLIRRKCHGACFKHKTCSTDEYFYPIQNSQQIWNAAIHSFVIVNCYMNTRVHSGFYQICLNRCLKCGLKSVIITV